MLLTDPVGAGEDADYAMERTSRFGEPVPLGMLDVHLETADFRTLPGSPR
ncbi:hypothetical protein [Streptomyces peucetius]